MSATLEQRVFAQTHAPDALGYLRSVAEDAEQSARMADQLRKLQTGDAIYNPPYAEQRRPERNDEAERLERGLVREAALLFTLVSKYTDPEVFTTEVKKVLTEAEVDSLRFSLAVVQSVGEVEDGDGFALGRPVR